MEHHIRPHFHCKLRENPAASSHYIYSNAPYDPATLSGIPTLGDSAPASCVHDLPLHIPTVYFWFVGNHNGVQALLSNGTYLLKHIIVPHQYYNSSWSGQVMLKIDF